MWVSKEREVLHKGVSGLYTLSLPGACALVQIHYYIVINKVLVHSIGEADDQPHGLLPADLFFLIVFLYR